MNKTSKQSQIIQIEQYTKLTKTQNCPSCGFIIGVRAGSKEAICQNCGFKDPCCE